MLSLPIAFPSALGVFAPVFSRPMWQHVNVLITGAVLAPGKRTVTAILSGSWDAAQRPTFSRIIASCIEPSGRLCTPVDGCSGS